jgi:hypothetical protein
MVTSMGAGWETNVEIVFFLIVNKIKITATKQKEIPP